MSGKVSAPKTVRSAFTAKIKSSGLADKDIKTHKLQLVKPSELIKKRLPDGYAFEIPYFDPRGAATGFKRYRYLDPLPTLDKKEVRYVQEHGSLNEVYLSPLKKWHEIVKDPTIQIIITEGELKAIAACKADLNCIGLGGVWCFKSAAHGMDLIPALASWFVWNGRDVVILYDSDAATNKHIRAAEGELGYRLHKLGAHVRVARMPRLDTDPKSKTGLDDFLLVKSSDDLRSIIDKAVSFEGQAMLFGLNTEVVLVRDPPMVIELSTRTAMLPRNFTDVIYGDRLYAEEIPTATGSRVVVKNAAKEWLKWPMRHNVQGVTYAPDQSQIIDNRNYNSWAGWGADGQLKPVSGDVSLWQELLDHLFDDALEARTWFEQWCAYPIKYPGVKLNTATVLWSAFTGQGKSLVGETLGKIYGANYELISEGQLTNSFNEWAAGRQFVMVDDVNGKTNRLNADLLKGMITRSTVRVNKKFLPSYSIPDTINYLFTSNKPDCFQLDDADRRFFVHMVNSGRRTAAWYAQYVKWIHSVEGQAALFYHFRNLDTNKFNPKGVALYTHAKRDMIEDGKSDVARWVHAIKNDPDSVLIRNKQVVNYELWSVPELLKLYDPAGDSKLTINGLGLQMANAGMVRVGRDQVRTYDGRKKLWALRNIDRWHSKQRNMSDADIGRIYDKERGMESPHHKKEKHK